MYIVFYSMQSLLPSDDLYPSDYNADTVAPVGTDLQCRGKETRGRVTLKRTDDLMYEFEVPETVSYKDLEGMSCNVQRVVFHSMSDYSLSDTVLYPPTRRFIEEYQSAVRQQHPHTTSKLWQWRSSCLVNQPPPVWLLSIHHVTSKWPADRWGLVHETTSAPGCVTV